MSMTLSGSDGITTPNGSTFNGITGMIVAFGNSTAPTGWLSCDGSAVSRTTYSVLFSAIGTTWGSGDGSTTFNVPDLRETGLVGTGTRASGVTTHETYTVGQFRDDQMQGHYHQSQAPQTSGSSSVWGLSYWTANRGGDFSTEAYQGTIRSPTADAVGNGTPRVGATTHGKQAGVLWCIKY